MDLTDCDPGGLFTHGPRIEFFEEMPIAANHWQMEES
jgi:hypothetical protein